MGVTIAVNTQESIDKIQTLLSSIEGDIKAYTEQYTSLESLLANSKGEFTDALVEQLAEEKRAMEASIALLNNICDAMQDAVDRFIQADKAGT